MSRSDHHGVGAIVTNASRTRFFVQQKDRDYRWFPLGYSLFGGAVEPGESASEALARELKEELGEAAQPLLEAGARLVLNSTPEQVGVAYSLFEIVVDEARLDALASVPVLEGERGAVVARDELRSLPWIWKLSAVIDAYLTEPPMSMRPANLDDLPRLQEVREAAFAPVFASFRALLGDEIYERAQAPEDAKQGELLTSLLAPESPWRVHVAELDGVVAGFVAARHDVEARLGEIGLNAVHPDYAGRGIGTAMYRFVLEQMRAAGLQVATVATGGDPSHAPARRAYEKAGFTAQIPSVWLCRKL